MDIKQAVEAARSGDKKGFDFIFDSTYYNAFYLALKYIKDRSDAENAVVRAYQTAWENAAEMPDSEKLREWLGEFLVRTCLEHLKSKKPLIFSAVGGEDNNGESFNYETFDDKADYCANKTIPAETVNDMTNEMLGCLSEEQRICALMYHFDGRSTQSISHIIGCSEDIVKSRLYYGRNALRSKAAEFAAKGLTQPNTPPVPMFVHLLRTQRLSPEMQKTGRDFLSRTKHGKSREKEKLESNNNKPAADNYYQSPGEVIPENKTSGDAELPGADIRLITDHEKKMPDSQSTPPKSKHKAYEKAKEFLGTLTGKVTAGALILLIAVGVIMACGGEAGDDGGKSPRSSRKRNTDGSSSQTSQVNHDEIDYIKFIDDSDYPEFISGGLSKTRLELVLSRLDPAFDEQDTYSLVNDFCYEIIINGSEHEFTYSGETFSSDIVSEVYASFYADEINSILDCVNRPHLAEDDEWVGYGNSDGIDTVSFYVKKKSDRAAAVITNAQYSNSAMKIRYIYQYESEVDSYTQERTARLNKDEKTGKYYIVSIEETKDSVDTDNYLADDTSSQLSSVTSQSESSQKSESKNIVSKTESSASQTVSQSTAEERNFSQVQRDEPASHEIAQEISSGEEINAESESAESERSDAKSIEDNYSEVLDNLSGESYRYFLYDFDKNGIKELVVEKRVGITNESVTNYCIVYTCERSDEGYALKTCETTISHPPTAPEGTAFSFKSSEKLLVPQNDLSGLEVYGSEEAVSYTYRILLNDNILYSENRKNIDGSDNDKHHDELMSGEEVTDYSIYDRSPLGGS